MCDQSTDRFASWQRSHSQTTMASSAILDKRNAGKRESGKEGEKMRKDMEGSGGGLGT